jgi:hypothetical protein
LCFSFCFHCRWSWHHLPFAITFKLIKIYSFWSLWYFIVSSTLPKTSGSLLEYYLIFQLGMGTIVVIITAVELRLHFQSKPVPRWLKVVFSFLKV